MAIKNYVPWWGKIVSKLVLAKIPNRHVFFRSVGLFKHGDMIDPKYAIGVFIKHFKRVKEFLPDNFSVLEIGPGDTISTAVVAYAFGASRTILVDSGNYASHSMDVYRKLIDILDSYETIRDVKVLKTASSVRELLEATNSTYFTDGLQSLKGIKSDSIDFIFSNAVLEHIYFDEFENTIRELYRISSKNGYMSHTVDFTDHLGNSLNSLRIKRSVWESKAFRNSGFYTNRLRHEEVCNYIENTGFRAVKISAKKWDVVPIALNKLSEEYKNRTDLNVFMSDIVYFKT